MADGATRNGVDQQAPTQESPKPTSMLRLRAGTAQPTPGNAAQGPGPATRPAVPRPARLPLTDSGHGAAGTGQLGVPPGTNGTANALSPRVEASAGGHPSHEGLSWPEQLRQAGSHVGELIDDPWESEESGIAVAPPSVSPSLGMLRAQEDSGAFKAHSPVTGTFANPAALSHALRATHAEILRLEAIVARLRTERDMARSELAAVRDDAARKLAEMGQELRAARVNAQHARDAQRRAEQRAIVKLDQLQRQVADLQTRVATAQELLVLLK